MILEATLFLSGICIIGMCYGSYLMGYGMRGIHDSRRDPPKDPPHTGWKKK